MTERLAQLMAAEADRLDVPPAPTADVLGRGRGLRRRRRAGQVAGGVAVLAVLAVVGAGGVLVSSGDGGRGPVAPAAPSAPGIASAVGAVFSIGPTVYLDGGRVSATVDDVVVKSMYFTSAGVLVRHGDNSNSDGGGPQRFSLVTPDGTVRRVSATTDEVVPGVDVNQPYLAYAVVVDGTVEVVVHDVATDEEVARVAVPDAQEWGGWSAPPVELDGDRVYVGTDDVARVVDWRTGEVTEDPTIEPGPPPEISGGRIARFHDGAGEVIDATSGEVLLRLPVDPMQTSALQVSPDGRYALQLDQVPDADNLPTFRVFDVDTGDAVTINRPPYGWTWSADDQLFYLDDGIVTTCSVTTTECTESNPDLAVLPGSRPGQDDYSDDLVMGTELHES